jgi:hypothetical protein
MKNNFVILFCLISTVIFSQKKAMKKFESLSTEIEISTIGLDDLVLENSTSNFIEVTLFAEDPNEQHIIINSENNVLQIEFNLAEFKTEEKIFRKFITKRLHRASAIIKIPKGKKVAVFGENINIESKSYQDDLSIFIEKGILKLHEIKANTVIKLYEGSIFGILKNTNVNIDSKIGKIKIDDAFYEKKYQKKSEKNHNNFSVTTLKANIFLTTK